MSNGQHYCGASLREAWECGNNIGTALGQVITESVDSVCRDTTYTQYNYANTKESLQISETVHLSAFITTYRSSSSVFMTNKTPRVAKNRRESTAPGTRKTGM